MALSQTDRSRLYNDAFQTNAKAMLGESGLSALMLKTELDVANMEIGVLSDQLKVSETARETVEKELAAITAAPPSDDLPEFPEANISKRK